MRCSVGTTCWEKVAASRGRQGYSGDQPPVCGLSNASGWQGPDINFLLLNIIFPKIFAFRSFLAWIFILKVRAPHIPEAVLKKRSGMDMDEAVGDDGEKKPKRKLARELELEQGRDYRPDMNKDYLLKNQEEKYDVLPEIWEGHNIGEFLSIFIP